MTSGRERVYRALVEICADGWPATVREVAAHAGFSSPATVHLHLWNLLAEDGLVEFHPRNPQGGWLPILKGTL